MNWIVLIVIGFVAGFIARKILFRGRQGGGVGLGPLIQTTVIGVVGSLLGWFVGGFFIDFGGNPFHPIGLGLAVVGAVVVMAIARMFSK